MWKKLITGLANIFKGTRHIFYEETYKINGKIVNDPKQQEQIRQRCEQAFKDFPI